MYEYLLTMGDFSDRLAKVAAYYGVQRPVDFAKITGFSHQTATNYLKGVRIPTAESIKIIIQTFDKINPEWLVTGSGNMFRVDVVTDSDPVPYGNGSKPMITCRACAEKSRIIEALEKTIKAQEITIEALTRLTNKK